MSSPTSIPTPGRSPWLLIVAASTVVVVVAFVVDAIAEVDGSVRSALRVVVVVGAALSAGTLYQRWSIVPVRTPAHHAMAAAGLLGGALVASSAFSNGPGVFGTGTTGALGAAALLVALLAARFTLAAPKESR